MERDRREWVAVALGLVGIAILVVTVAIVGGGTERKAIKLIFPKLTGGLMVRSHRARCTGRKLNDPGAIDDVSWLRSTSATRGRPAAGHRTRCARGHCLVLF